METMGETFARLRGAQKGRAKGAPAYSVYVNRPVGRLLAVVAYRLGLTPNQVSLVSALFTFSGIAALEYAWDSADGQVARLRGGGSLAGEWLDHFVDALKISSLHSAVFVGLTHVEGLATAWLAVPLVFAVVANTTFFGMILNDLLKGKRGVASAHSEGGGGNLRSILLLPTDFGILVLSCVVWGWPSVFVVVYGQLLVACAAFLLLAAVKWFRDMRRIDAGSAT